MVQAVELVDRRHRRHEGTVHLKHVGENGFHLGNQFRGAVSFLVEAAASRGHARQPFVGKVEADGVRADDLLLPQRRHIGGVKVVHQFTNAVLTCAVGA